MNWGRRSWWQRSQSPHVLLFSPHIVCTRLTILSQKRNMGQLTRAAGFMLATHPAIPSSVKEMCPRGAVCSLMTPVKSGKDWRLGVLGCATVGATWPMMWQSPAGPKPKLSQRREEERDWRGFKEIYLGKGKIKGIYGDPAKDKLNKLTPKILPWENTQVHLPSLITVHSVTKFEPEISMLDRHSPH